MGPGGLVGGYRVSKGKGPVRLKDSIGLGVKGGLEER